MQIFVRKLQTGVIPLTIDKGTSLASFKSQIQTRSGIPVELQRLRHGLRDIAEDKDIDLLVEGSTVCVLLRLVGGKGGFGSLLRVQGRDTKATTNFEACRDLTGRRLRHVNAVKKMEEWEKKSKERELEQIALQHITDRAKEIKRVKRKPIDRDVVAELQRETVDNVKEAVQAALKTATQSQIHKSKKRKILLDEDSDVSEEEEEASVSSNSVSSSNDTPNASSDSRNP